MTTLEISSVTAHEISNNWDAIMNRVRNREDNLHCSAEGHISHIFADRLSSRPLGWSVVGADKMAKLRIYKKNDRDMLELVRWQKQNLPKAAGAEEVIYSADEVMKTERKNKRELGETSGFTSLFNSVPTNQKDSSIKKSHLGIVEFKENRYSETSQTI